MPAGKRGCSEDRKKAGTQHSRGDGSSSGQGPADRVGVRPSTESGHESHREGFGQDQGLLNGMQGEDWFELLCVDSIPRYSHNILYMHGSTPFPTYTYSSLRVSEYSTTTSSIACSL